MARAIDRARVPPIRSSKEAGSSPRKTLSLPFLTRVIEIGQEARDFVSTIDPRADRSRYLRIINMTVQYLKNLSFFFFLCNLHIQIQVYSRNVQWFIALTSLTSKGTVTAA